MAVQQPSIEASDEALTNRPFWRMIFIGGLTFRKAGHGRPPQVVYGSL